MTATPARIDPRIRERRMAVQRALGRRRLRILAVGAVAVVVAGVAFLVIESPLLDVDAVPVRGAQHVSADDVRNAAGVHPRDALLFVDTGAVARRLERLPWVEHAEVTRDWPGTLQISVREYRADAFARVPEGILLFAANGRAFARVDEPPAGATEVRGIREVPAIGESLSPPEAAGVKERLPAELAQRVAAIDLGGRGLTLALADAGEVRFGAPDDVEAKAAAAVAVLTSGTVDGCFRYLDVSAPETPVLRRCD